MAEVNGVHLFCVYIYMYIYLFIFFFIYLFIYLFISCVCVCVFECLLNATMKLFATSASERTDFSSMIMSVSDMIVLHVCRRSLLTACSLETPVRRGKQKNEARFT